MLITHTCPDFDKVAIEPKHGIGYSIALTRDLFYEEKANCWVAGNDDGYAVAVRFCPWCGIELASLLTPKQ